MSDMYSNDSDNDGDGDDLCVEVVGPSWNPAWGRCYVHFIYQRESYPSPSSNQSTA